MISIALPEEEVAKQPVKVYKFSEEKKNPSITNKIQMSKGRMKTGVEINRLVFLLSSVVVYKNFINDIERRTFSFGTSFI